MFKTVLSLPSAWSLCLRLYEESDVFYTIAYGYADQYSHYATGGCVTR